ncbi:molybdate ABC transporter substrate-binding protein [Yoonia sp. SS1-5]|uniref:Molybdate ABC transporter substrate-binding protein n=1 Tax=Yoonia rhodophyticola TaxID=3137370 RepID=A0AAN0MCK0_9RHOB
MLTRLFMLLVMLLCPIAATAEIVVFAAASLKEPIDALAAEFGDVSVSYAGSGKIARQVGQGAPADLVLLANADWMDVLVETNALEPDSVADIASNALVLIGPRDAGDVLLHGYGMASALGDGRLAVGLTDAVPAGIYAKAALTSLNMWEPLSHRLAEVDSVRAALNLVARGETPLGVVYQTDAGVTDAVRIVARFPTDSYPPIRYVGAVTAGADPQASAFLDFLTGAAGQATLQEAGFLPPIRRP